MFSWREIETSESAVADRVAGAGPSVGRTESIDRAVQDFHDLTERGRARRLRRSVAAALTHYPLEVARVRLIDNATNGVFRLDTTDEGRYVVRVGLGGEVGHAPDVVADEVAWLDAIGRDGAVRVPSVVPTIAGEPFVTLEVDGVPAPRNIVIFTWLDGPLVGERLRPESIFGFGTTMARLHRHGAAFTPPVPDALPVYDRVLPFEEADHVGASSVVSEDGRRADVFHRARRRVEDGIADLDAADRQILHGDLHPWNAKILRGEISVFDFEDLMYGWPLQDIATTLYYFHGNDDQEAHFEAFEAGYRSVAPWPARSPAEIETFLIGRALVLANYVLAAPELRHKASHWIPRFEARIAALLEGRRYTATS